MAKIRILLAEDDANFGTIFQGYLINKGYPTTLCKNGEEALNKFKSQDFDLCLLDVMMPVMDGFTLAKEIKKIKKATPIIFLTAKNQQESILEGFGVGADDYITKPFSMDELLMRIHAVYSRYELANEKPSTYQIGSFTFDSPRHTLTKGDKVQKLTSKESDLLLMLCENLGNTLERPVALKAIWDEDTYFNARSMDVYVTKLRKYFSEDPSVQLLNVHGVGFKLVVNDTAGK